TLIWCTPGETGTDNSHRSRPRRTSVSGLQSLKSPITSTVSTPPTWITIFCKPLGAVCISKLWTSTACGSETGADAEDHWRESGVTSYALPKRWPVCAVSSSGPASQCTDPSRSANRDWREHASTLAALSEKSARSGVLLATPDGAATSHADAALVVALPLSPSDAILLNEKFVNVAVIVAEPNRAVVSPILPHAPASATSAEEMTAIRHGRATPPPNHTPPCW